MICKTLMLNHLQKASYNMLLAC